MKKLLKWLWQLWLRLWGLSKNEEVETNERAERHASTQTAQTTQVKRHIRREWTEDEVELLRRSYPHCLNSVLAKHLNRSEDSINKKAQKLGLKKHEGFFAQVARTTKTDRKGSPSIEQQLAEIMAMKKLIGDFSLYLYFDDIANVGFQYAAWLSCCTYEHYYHAANFKEVLNRVKAYIETRQ
jgi:hypothetical protein